MIYIVCALIIVLLVITAFTYLNYNNMNKKVKTLLFGVAGIALIIWLLSKNKYQCPKCNYPLTKGVSPCPNCSQLIQWENSK